jgi:YgiT-type zinc finger domain-containing protein
MKCFVCKHGETEDGQTTVTLERGTLTLVIKRVPARVCANCGETYLNAETTERVLAALDAAEQAGVQVDVREYVA